VALGAAAGFVVGNVAGIGGNGSTTAACCSCGDGIVVEANGVNGTAGGFDESMGRKLVSPCSLGVG
jgi:hypothetical protein